MVMILGLEVKDLPSIEETLFPQPSGNQSVSVLA
jgi:hypothetical protein